MFLALLIFLAVVVSLWRTSHREQHARPAPGPSRRERELSGLRERFASSDMSVEELEGQIADVLEARSPEPMQYTEHWEIHVHDAPPGHSLHIHLP